MDLIAFFAARWQTIAGLTSEHVVIVAVAMGISVVLGVAIGVAISFHAGAARAVLGLANVMMTIPSLALFSLLIPVLGLGNAPAIVGLVVYTQLPLIRNVHTGLTGIDPAVIEAARGMGLTERRILFKIRIPLAFPAVMAGIRTATVMGIGIGAIAAYIGAGGLGVLIFQGISWSNDTMVLTGAILISAIAILADRVLARIQRSVR